MDNNHTPNVDLDDLKTQIALGEDEYSQRGMQHPLLQDPQIAQDIEELREIVAITQSARCVRVSGGPSDAVWDAICTEVDSLDPPVQERPALQAVPDLDAANTTEPTSQPAGDQPQTTPARWQRSHTLLSLAAGVVIGAVGVGAWFGGKGSVPEPIAQPGPTVTVTSTPQRTIEQVAALDTLDTQANRGKAELVSSTNGLKLLVNTESFDPQGGYLEVWLINQDTQRMVSIGVLPTGGSNAQAAFPVSRDLIREGYTIVDISREQFDDKPEHSGDSVVRGALEA